MITILQNFVIGKQERLDTLANEILPDVADFFSEYDFCINYNSTKNLEIVQSLYEKHVDKLSFYNDLTMDWGKIVQSMLYEVETDYVFMFMEDFKLCNFDKDYFDGLIKEIVKYDCKFVAMHRIEDVKCYGTNKKYFHLYDTKEYIHLVSGDKYPGTSLSSVAIYNKDFLMNYLSYYNTTKKSDRFPLATPNCYEWFSSDSINNMFPNERLGIPKRAVIEHYEPYDEFNVKVKERV